MEAKNIADLIQKGHEALDSDDAESAKLYALKAIAGTNYEKDKFLTGLLNVTVTEQQLADWYGGCSFILNQIGEDMTAARCFYTATIFDPQWNVQSHIAVSDVLWGSLVFFRGLPDLSLNIQKIRGFLAELDSLAKLAERRKKWSVCVAIDGDINKIYSFLRRIALGPRDIIAEPGRKNAMWRSARCYLELNLHQEVRKVCTTILQHVCDYDDPEALAIWARSLFMTRDYDLAFQKNELALKYCQDGGDRDRLQAFKLEIQEKLALAPPPQREPDEEWLEGTNVNKATATDTNQHFDAERRKKRRHKRPKAIDRSGQSTPFSRAQSLDRATGSRSSSNTPSRVTQNINVTTKTINSVVERLKLEGSGKNRSRNVSSCSTATTATDASGFGTETSYDYSVSDSDSDDDSSVNYAASSKTESPDLNLMSEQDIEIDSMQEKMSFYEQSCRFYQQNDEVSENLGRAETEENLLKTGITLNMSFLHQFEDARPDILNRENFYTEFLDKCKLQELLIKNPKKYIKCVIQIEGCHDAYCTPVDAHDSINIIEISGRSKIGQAFNEDEVIVEILDDQDAKDKRYGRVVGVWNRQRHKDTKHPVFICTLDDMESHLVRPMCKTIPKIHILNREIKQKYQTEKARRYKVEIYEYDERAGILCNPRIVEVNPADNGSVIFLVAFIKWGPRHIYPRGAIIKRLPSGSSIATGLMVLNLQHEVPTLYKKRTVDQVSSIVKRAGDEPSEHLLQDRVDLTNLNIFTIDPPGSKDLDDALSVEKIDGGYKVGVHIADVAMYVPKDSPLDEEARNRATTFYPGIRKPRNMIPEPLSSNLCSLLQDKLRLTISVFFYIGSNGRLLQMEGNNFEIVKSYIRSKRQLTYGQAQSLIFAQPGGIEDKLTSDIKCLFNIAHAMRKNRLGNAMYALDVDWEEAEIDESEGETREAHYLIEEFMIMTNRKVAEKLLRTYRSTVPLRCQPPPSKENLEAFFKRNDQYLGILVRFQDKPVGPQRPSVYDCLNEQTTKTVMLSKSVWDAMMKSPKAAAPTFIRKDDIHPLQLVVYQHWLAIQERAGYRCSGSLTGIEDGTHFSLNMFPYTHFTSPIRRYNDLIIHRLLHAVFQKIRSPYEKEEIDNICLHINSVSKRAKAYEKGCRSLQQAIDFKTNPKMVNCFVDEVNDKGLTLCSPMLKYVAKGNRELTFNRLDMGVKPEVFEDPNTHWNKVKAVWRKRLYDFHVRPNYPPDRGNELRLNPHKGIVFLPLYEWAKILKCTMEGHVEDLSRAIKKANISHHGEGLDDVSTESLDPLQIQPNTRFSMTFSRGQQVKIQMSASPHKGIIAPKPMLYNMTNNVKLCLQHTEDPVLYLYRYVTRATCDQYKTVKLYLERWLPLMLMESATGIVKNEESCTINNVQVKFSGERKGKFALGLAECEVRNIELSGTVSDDEDDDEEGYSGASSYDWLCLKATVSSDKKAVKSKSQDLPTSDSVWVGHAEVTKVKRKKEEKSTGKLTVSFSLHDRAPELPLSFYQTSADQRFSVEILRKSEVDRRTETYIKMLPSVQDTLATKIALNKAIPDLDRDHKHIASLIERDLYYDASSDDPRRKPLPPNNKKQQEAIDKALMSRFSLIQGPPGTGKTYTGIKLVSLFNKVNGIQHKEGKQKKQVLFCGPSNRSVDLVAEWMYYRMGNYCPDFVRVYGRSIEALDFPIPGRTFLSKRSTRNQKTSPVLYPVALHHLIRQKGKKYAEEINAYDKLFKANNYEPMPEKVAAYVRIVREASIDEIRKHDVILCTTAVGSNPKVLKATSVHQVIVDEAGMCPEPQCLVPIIATKAEQVVLIGDHKQLRPIIMCKEAGLLGLETSLFERYAVTNTKHINNVKFTMLEEQYRMNPQICRFPSEKFYDNALITMPGLWKTSRMHIWPKHMKTSYPHIFVHVEGEEKVLTVTTEDGNEQSKSNALEIDEVIKVYSYFTREETSQSVQILSQYNAQVSEIKRRLKDEGYVEENVSTVVSSQGGEWDYVIFSTVRSLPDYKIESNPTLGWCKHNLGFITDQNQINVALTRARKGLIIIGNKNLLSCDQFVWRKLIQHYDNRECVKTPDEFPPRTVRTRLQRMEENIQESERRYGESMFIKGEATSYTGSFDDWQEEGRGRRHRRNPKHR
ncbi:helicase with zinc finger domain 2-like isoform X2 [Mercenaria mercenaria]|nr:helicase with zinc finger domain 2-like isoform X2 [Mercenaria mercenaria]